MANELYLGIEDTYKRYTVLRYEMSFVNFNSLWPSDAIWQQRSGSTLAQVMAWCRQPLPEPMLTEHQCGLVAFSWGWFHKKCSRYISGTGVNSISISLLYQKSLTRGPGLLWQKTKLGNLTKNINSTPQDSYNTQSNFAQTGKLVRPTSVLSLRWANPQCIIMLGPAPLFAIWRRRGTPPNGNAALRWKSHCHWPKRLRLCHPTTVMQDPVNELRMSCAVWGLWCPRQVSRVWISNTPHSILGYIIIYPYSRVLIISWNIMW